MQGFWVWFFGFLALIGAFTVVLHPNPFRGALGLLLNFLSLAGLYMVLYSPLLSLIQVIVYAGGIIVFFIFVIFLLNLRRPLNDREFSFKNIVSIFLVTIFATVTVVALSIYPFSNFSMFYVSAKDMGKFMLTDGLFAFEFSSFIILLGIVVAVAVVKLYREGER